MSRGTCTGTSVSSADSEAQRSGNRRRWVPLPSGRVRPASRRGRLWAWLLAAGLIAAAVRAHGAAADLRALPAHLGGPRLAWLSVAAAAQIASLAGSAAAQRQLLVIGNAHLPWRALFSLVLASTGLARVMPAGPVTGGAWQIREYRRRGTGAGTGTWAVLAGGFTSMVVILALLLAGAAIAAAGALFLLGCAAAVLAVGAAGLTMAPRRACALSRRLSQHSRRSAAIARIAAAVAGLSRQHAGLGWAAGVLACTAAGLAADAGVLTACFGLAGLPVPWRGLLFAYAAGQVAGRLVPLPGGIGGVEGGMLGALTLTGTSPAAAATAVIVYRIAGYWALGAAGTTLAAAVTRRRPRGPEPAPQQLAGCPGRGAEGDPAPGVLAMRGHAEAPSRGAGADAGRSR
jgi:uncharacterized membrane protein YbhN (UPF0104 family)